MEFKNIDTFQVELTGNVDTVFSTVRGGVKIRVKNPNASGGNDMHIGPATNRAGDALASTTGYTLSPQESIEIEFSPDGETPGQEFSVKGTTSDKLQVLVLHP